MSFGGAVPAMATSLKNNKRPRVSTFKKIKGYKDVKYKKGSIDKKTSPQQLREIREQLQKKNKKESVIAIISITSVIVILYILVNFVKF